MLLTPAFLRPLPGVPGAAFAEGRHTPQDCTKEPQRASLPHFPAGLGLASSAWGMWHLLPRVEMVGSLAPQQGKPMSFLAPTEFSVLSIPLSCPKSPGREREHRQEGSHLHVQRPSWGS